MDGFYLAWFSEEPHWAIARSFSGVSPIKLCPEQEAKKYMAIISEQLGVRSAELEGFSLFKVKDDKWQMSVRRKSEAGWDVKHIPAEQAEAILSILETSGHPDGPITVVPLLSGQPALAADGSTSPAEWEAWVEALAANSAARTALVRALVAP